MKTLKISGSTGNAAVCFDGTHYAQIFRGRDTDCDYGTEYTLWADAACNVNQTDCTRIQIGSIHAHDAVGDRFGNIRVFDAYSFTGRIAQYRTRAEAVYEIMQEWADTVNLFPTEPATEPIVAETEREADRFDYNDLERRFLNMAVERNVIDAVDLLVSAMNTRGDFAAMADAILNAAYANRHCGHPEARAGLIDLYDRIAANEERLNLERLAAAESQQVF